jgi:hypothetical protein
LLILWCPRAQYLIGSVLEILKALWCDDDAKLVHRDIKVRVSPESVLLPRS